MISIITSLFISGLLFGSGPCLASCGPLVISYVAGTKKGIWGSAVDYCLFSLARVSVYIVLGLAIFFIGQFAIERMMSSFSGYIYMLGGIAIVVIGLWVAFGKRLPPNTCRFDKNMLLLGGIVGFLPCAPLVAIFSYLGLISKTWLQSVIYSLAFGIGTFISPLVLLAMLGGATPGLLTNKKERYAKIFQFICGLVIIFLGLQLFRRAL